MAIEYIGLETTNRCNYACVHCLRADIAPRNDLPPDLQKVIGPKNPRLDIPLEIVEKIIDEARPLKISKVSFTGGEPTVHPQFGEIVKKFCLGGYRFGMVTNGTRFEKTYQLIRHHSDQLLGICFSMDGATEQTMDGIRERGSFRTALQAISVCKVKGLPFSMQMVITASNYHEIEAFAVLASTLGAIKVAYVPLQPTLQTTYKKLNLPPSAWHEIKQEIIALKHLYRVSVISHVGFPDDTPWVDCDALQMRVLYVDYLGNLTFCCQLSDYADSQSRTDIVANLADANLWDAYQKYVAMITNYQKEKLRRCSNGLLTKLDFFPCWYCSKYFKKVEWMKKFPDGPWYEDAMSQNLKPNDMPLEKLPDL